MSPRRSYDQHCSTARALDAVGDRWTLLIVRELLAGPRRYTDLHADLPGVSTDVLASRLKDMERDGIATRRRLPPPAAASVYELTPRGRDLLPVLQALGGWGAAVPAERSPTDAVRAHWLALPLLRLIEGNAGRGQQGLVEVRLDEGVFHLWVGAGEGAAYGDGAAPREPDLRLDLDMDTCARLGGGDLTLDQAVLDGMVVMAGEGALADALRGRPLPAAPTSAS
ncbi:helix-turn-helix domain-containing protein [Streptomyces sp. NPDC048664]|uniref:winged helix-turn-helix transcriptional regulator n=1 Tax=Streptomyces sp. NPDC048664 TaxID=3154505 RepID=UPI003437C1D4